MTLFRGNDEKKSKHSNAIPCPQGCRLKIHLDQLATHIQKECPYRCVFCYLCKMPLLYVNVQKHLEECAQIPSRCPFSSGDEAPSSETQVNRSTTTNECNHLREYKKQIAETVQNEKENSAHRLDLLLQLNKHQKLALEMQVVELKASVDTWRKKSSILEKELSGIQTQLCQKANYSLVAEESRTTAERNLQNSATEQLLDKVKKLSTLLKSIEKDISTTKENIFKRQNEQATELKKFTEFVLDLLETSNKSTALSIQKQQLDMQKYTSYMQQMQFKTTHVGVLIWKVKKFSRLQTETKHSHNSRITSVPFYTNEYGYKLCMELYPNGGANGEYLSLSLCIMRGGYDAILKWPVSYKASFILLDQLEGKQPFQATLYSVNEPQYVGRPTSERNSALTFFHYFPIAELYPRYMMNDQIFIKAVVNFANDNDCGYASAS